MKNVYGSNIIEILKWQHEPWKKKLGAAQLEPYFVKGVVETEKKETGTITVNAKI